MNTATGDRYQLPYTIPHKISVILRDAVHECDAIANDKTSRYSLDSASWHDGRDSFCQVCLAGSFMAKQIEDPTLTVAPEQFDERSEKILRLIEHARCGNVGDVIAYYNTAWPDLFDEDDELYRRIFTSIPFHLDALDEHSWENARGQLLQRADDFERIGL